MKMRHNLRGGEVEGSYPAGWNDCLRLLYPKVSMLKKGEANPEYIKGWNDCLKYAAPSTTTRREEKE